MAHLSINNGFVQDYTIVLASKNLRKLGQITGFKNVSNSNNLNSANEFAFSVYKADFFKLDRTYLINKETHKKLKQNIWNQIVDEKLIWIKELDEYFQIKVSLSDSKETYKTIIATSLCEAELSQILVGNIEINTEADIERDDYKATVFYNPNEPSASLLHRVLANAPHYTIGHVDESLCKLQRMFSLSDPYIYDFLTGECSEQFNCLFQFNTKKREISVYDLMTVCNDCGHRGEYYGSCPKCESRNLKYFGRDTTILVDKYNLTEQIQLDTNADETKNCFRLIAGDDLMTATVRMLNPTGSDSIYMMSDFQKKDMSEELSQRLAEYNTLVESKTPEYEKLVTQIYDLTDDILYLEHSMMPTIEQAEVTANTEVSKLTAANLNPLGLSTVTSSTSVATVESGLKNYASVYIKTGYVKLETENGKFTYKGTDANGNSYGTWTGRFKVTNYSDEEDVAYSSTLTITVYDNYYDFMDQKVKKALTQDDDEGSVFDVLNIADLEEFKKALTYYSKSRLESFYDAIQSGIDVLIQADQANKNAELYEDMYQPYYQKLQACQAELDKRQKEIDAKQAELDEADMQRTTIQKSLDLKTFLGNLFNEFCSYKREQRYTNSNYISDGLSNTELIEKAKEFVEVAKEELKKACEPQYTLSSTLYNLLVLPEFEPILDDFELGNWIRLRVDGILYRLRLIAYTVNFDDLNTINVEFSTVTKVRDLIQEAHDVINSAKSMSTTYGYVMKQAEKGNDANSNIKDWVQNGLDSGKFNIINNVNEEVIYTNHGLLLRTKDDITGEYSPKQSKLTHNVIAFTSDNWNTVEQVLGEHNYTYYDEASSSFKTGVGYGNTAKFLSAGYVYGSQIIGGKIYSDNYSSINKTGSYLDLENGRFSLGGGALSFDGTSLIIDTPNLPSADDIPTKVSQLTNDSGYQTKSQVTTITKDTITTEYVNALNITAGSVAAEDITGTTITGKTISGGNLLIGNKSGTYAEINTDGKLTCTNADIRGVITSSSGDIGGWKIGEHGIYNDTIQCGFLNHGSIRLYAGGITYAKMIENANNGYAVDDFYGNTWINSEGTIHCTDLDTENIVSLALTVWGDIHANSFVQNSAESMKKNFEKLENGLSIVKDIDIYKFNYTTEEDSNKKHIGFVIGDDYNYSPDVTNKENNGADVYSLVSVCVKAIQELSYELDELKGIKG